MKTERQTTSRIKSAPKPAQPGRASPPPPPAKRRVMVVEDHPLTREGLATIINLQADLEVCGGAGNPAEAMSKLPKLTPDLLVTDLTMGGRSGIEFLKDVHALRPKLPMLVLSMHDEMLYAERVLRAGARAYLMKDAGSDKVLEVIRLVLSGQSYVSPPVSARLLAGLIGGKPQVATSPVEKLTDREFEVFQLLGSGKSTKEIAGTLHLSPKTVAVHRGAIKEKLQVANLVHYASSWVAAQAARSG